MIRTLIGSVLVFIITLVCVPLVRSFCERARIFDRPGALKIHAHPVPRLGGVALFAGILAGMFAPGMHIVQIHLLVAMMLIWFVGLLDDVWGLHPGLRLVAQLATGVLLWRAGWHFWFAPGETGSLIVVCVFVLLFTNAFNFWDGSDGLAAGVACAIALSFAALPAGALGARDLSLAMDLAAACAAFLAYNFPPARIFMGDSGSTLLGFLISVVSLNSLNAASSTRHVMIFPFAVAALPIIDALRIIIVRISRRTSPLVGDRSHIYDVLLAKGWTPRTVAVTSWSITALCGGFSVLVFRARVSDLWLLLPLAAVATWIVVMAAAQKQFVRYAKPKECSSNCGAD